MFENFALAAGLSSEELLDGLWRAFGVAVQPAVQRTELRPAAERQYRQADMNRRTKALIASSLAGAIVASLMMTMAWRHNPQGRFHEDAVGGGALIHLRHRARKGLTMRWIDALERRP
jgi:hypothetical protein